MKSLKEERFTKDTEYVGTHRKFLGLAIKNTSGNILEIGSGHYSGSVIKELVEGTERKVVSVCHEAPYIKELKKDFSDFIYVEVPYDDRPVTFIPIYEEIIFRIRDEYEKFSVVLIDGGHLYERKKDIARLRSVTEIFVVHDTALSNLPTHRYTNSVYEYDSIIRSFPYFVEDDWTGGGWPYTTMLSDDNTLDFMREEYPLDRYESYPNECQRIKYGN